MRYLLALSVMMVPLGCGGNEDAKPRPMSEGRDLLVYAILDLASRSTLGQPRIIDVSELAVGRSMGGGGVGMHRLPPGEHTTILCAITKVEDRMLETRVRFRFQGKQEEVALALPIEHGRACTAFLPTDSEPQVAILFLVVSTAKGG